MADRTVTAGTRACLHILPGTHHTLANDGDVPARALEPFVPGSLLGLVEAMGQLFAAGGPPDRERMLAVFAEHASEIVG